MKKRYGNGFFLSRTMDFIEYAVMRTLVVGHNRNSSVGYQSNTNV
jgi:hypothetical protein